MSNEYISVVGSMNYDLILKQERMPEKGETYIVDDIHFLAGGKGANQGVQVSKLGIPTYMFGCVGDDDFGKFITREMSSYGLNIDRLKLAKADIRTGIGINNVLPDGSLYANIYKGANFDVDMEYINENLDFILNSKIIILQLEIPTEIVSFIIQKAHEKGVYTILNAAPAKELDEEVLNKIDCLIVNESEASFYIGEIIHDRETGEKFGSDLADRIKDVLIITLGSKGSMLFSNGEIVYIEPEKVEDVADTTGAGDSYVGAFAYGKYVDMGNEESCRFASKVSAKTITKIGAQIAMPYISEIEN